jgi:hypothetical protein
MNVREQEWAKVNVPVDRGVAGLVSALSEFPGLEIIDSCEGSPGEPAWICFRFGRYWETKEPWREIAEFALGFLTPKLFERVGDSAALTIGPTPSGGMLADLAVRPGTQQEVQAALQAMAEEYHRREKPGRQQRSARVTIDNHSRSSAPSRQR